MTHRAVLKLLKHYSTKSVRLRFLSIVSSHMGLFVCFVCCLAISCKICIYSGCFLSCSSIRCAVLNDLQINGLHIGVPSHFPVVVRDCPLLAVQPVGVHQSFPFDVDQSPVFGFEAADFDQLVVHLGGNVDFES